MTTAPRVLQLKVTLDHIKPPIWRRIVVAEDVTLAALHEIDVGDQPEVEDHRAPVLLDQHVRRLQIAVQGRQPVGGDDVIVAEHLARGAERWNVPASSSVDQVFVDRDVLWIVDETGNQVGSLEVDAGDDTITINADCHTMYAK
jgi:Plasmid pRiA4b ORF-3-like protein